MFKRRETLSIIHPKEISDKMNKRSWKKEMTKYLKEKSIKERKC